MTGIQLHDVHFAYGARPVLCGVSGQCGPGEVVGLTGPNGAGKTTLTRLLMALEHPGAGRVEIGGRCTDGLGPADLADQVGYVFQHAGRQFFSRTVLADVAFGLRQLGWTAARAGAAANAALAEVDATRMAGMHPHDLSPADHKRIALAAALAVDPSVLILDEPTQGMDRPGMLRAAAVIRRRKASGTAVLLVTHDMAMLAECADRVWHLEEGHLVLDAPAPGLLRDPNLLHRHGFTEPAQVAVGRTAVRAGEPAPIRLADVVSAVRDRLRSPPAPTAG